MPTRTNVEGITESGIEGYNTFVKDLTRRKNVFSKGNVTNVYFVKK